MDFQRDYLVHYYEADSSHRLSLPALVQYFEDVAILHSASRGLDLAYYDENHCVWMLLKWDVVIHERPLFGQTVRVGTSINAIRKFLADRKFEMTAEDGTLLAEGRSNWLFVDTEKRRPMRVPDLQYEKFSVASDSEKNFVAIDEVSPVQPEEGDSVETPSGDVGSSCFFTQENRARFTDIDTNRHVNNVSYLGWALDSMPHDFFEGRTPERFRAQYRKELVVGGNARVVSLIEPPSGAVHAPSSASARSVVTRHSIRSAEEELCSVQIDWAGEGASV